MNIQEVSKEIFENGGSDNYYKFSVIKDLRNCPRWLQWSNKRHCNFQKTITSEHWASNIFSSIISVAVKYRLSNIIFKSHRFGLKPFIQNIVDEFAIHTIGIMIGTTGLSSKYILVLSSESIIDELFLKKAATPSARNMVQNEINTLTLLENEKNLSFVFPQILKSGGDWMLIKEVRGRFGRHTDWTDLHTKFVRDMYSLPKERAITGEHFDYQDASTFLPLLPEYVELFPSHGDFTPWNTSLRDNRLGVIDWELYRLRPFGYDFCHFHVQYMVMNTDLRSDEIYNKLSDNTEKIYTIFCRT